MACSSRLPSLKLAASKTATSLIFYENSNYNLGQLFLDQETTHYILCKMDLLAIFFLVFVYLDCLYLLYLYIAFLGIGLLVDGSILSLSSEQNSKRSPSMDNCIKSKIWYTYAMEYYSAVIKDKMLPFTTA